MSPAQPLPTSNNTSSLRDPARQVGSLLSREFCPADIFRSLAARMPEHQPTSSCSLQTRPALSLASWHGPSASERSPEKTKIPRVPCLLGWRKERIASHRRLTPTGCDRRSRVFESSENQDQPCTLSVNRPTAVLTTAHYTRAP